MVPLPRRRVTAIVLAAGFSRRMGSFKPLLPLGGATVLATVTQHLRAAGVTDISVVTGYHAEPLAAACARLGVRAVHNPDFEHGMFSSIAAGVAAQQADADACLLLPVDIPLVRPATLRQLLRYAEPPGAKIVYPAFLGQRGHPPRIHRDLFGAILEGERRASRQGLRAVLAEHEAHAVNLPVYDQRILLDMDTPEDYQRLSALAATPDTPSPIECEAVARGFGVDARVHSHMQRVAEVAECLAQALTRAGVALHPDRIVAAALLHDILRKAPHHAEAGAVAVGALGFTDVAPLIACHMDMRFQGDAPDDAAIVFLADKLVAGDRLVSLETRFQPAFERFAAQPEALRGARRRYDTACAIAAAACRLTRLSLPQLLSPLIEQEVSLP
ncbi:MAG: NTP transferase domain-containing protein [Paludibacterium sp.]|uniref:DVU_1551 family NTP transferase n=1 Tax=Paludibacterium sp. TaxID=1917523 RepID=UPI0025D97819|nr:NTP transferase domain-containing protein [Paludibacterium sp.]MBV8047200.1 NTP transferase domain-containing protein [Paludibacterium sp.]